MGINYRQSERKIWIQLNFLRPDNHTFIEQIKMVTN
jgi:hypothetical protein